MDKYEQRRVALKKLVDELGRGGIKKVASTIAKEPNYVSRMLYPQGKKGSKRIGEDSAELISSAFPNWLSHRDGGDVAHSASATTSAATDVAIALTRYFSSIDEMLAPGAKVAIAKFAWGLMTQDELTATLTASEAASQTLALNAPKLKKPI